MLRSVVIGFIGALALANCADDASNEQPPDACADPPCDDMCADPPCDDMCTDPPCDDMCTDPPCDDMCADPPCAPADLQFEHVPITIDDPIVNGTSLMVPVDGVSYAHDGAGAFVTAFGRDFNDPSQTFLWHLDETTGTHDKVSLTGQVFADMANLCVDEDWCQFIHRDAEQSIIAAPAADEMMRVSGSTSTTSPVTGPRPAASLINHSHRFGGGELFLFGATGPSGFDDTLHALTLSSGIWREAATGLAETDDNCLAFDTTSKTLYSLSGRTTTDGGNTTQALTTFTTIDVIGGTQATLELPAEIGARRKMSCAFDAQRGLLYVFGGAVIDDNFNDALNQFFNDLWVYDVAADNWTSVVANSTGGELGEPDMYGDRRFEGEPTGPNFGRNRGYMEMDTAGDRLLLIGSVPVFTHEQLYVLPLAGIELLL